MAKYKKIMPPRNAVIRGQDHLLAYITPQEAEILRSRGGSGDPGPMGIPAYDDVDESDMDTAAGGSPGGGGLGDPADDMDGPAGGDTSGDMGGGWSDGLADAIADTFGSAPSAAQQTMNRATEKDYGSRNPSAQDIEAARGFDFGSPASKAMEASFKAGFNQMGRGLGYNVSGRELDRAFGQLDARMANARAGYGLPGIFGSVLGLSGMKNLENIKSGLEKGHIPAFDGKGNIQGVFGPDPFGFGGLVYSGNPIEGNEATGWSPDFGGGISDDEETRPVNPATGQCDEGYIFDDDLQACRLDTSGSRPDDGAGGVIPEDGAYARMGLLDVAPTGLAEFQDRYGAGFGTPQDFTAANMDFRRRGATYPEYFRRPPQLTGYTLLS